MAFLESYLFELPPPLLTAIFPPPLPQAQSPLHPKVWHLLGQDFADSALLTF